MSFKNPIFGPRRGYHHGRLKDALVEAARSLVAERGLAGFTLAEAAKLVGVTGAAPYRHFSDRAALMSELARLGFELFGERLERAWAGGAPDAVTSLRRMGATYLAFARDEPGLYTAMFDNARNVAAPDSSTAAAHALETLKVAAAAILREAGKPDAGGRALALEIWSLSHGVAMLALAGHLSADFEGCDPAVILDTAARSLVRAAVERESA